jgi:hypothetical protein
LVEIIRVGDILKNPGEKISPEDLVRDDTFSQQAMAS